MRRTSICAAAIDSYPVVPVYQERQITKLGPETVAVALKRSRARNRNGHRSCGDSQRDAAPHVRRELAGSALLLFAVFLAGALVGRGAPSAIAARRPAVCSGRSAPACGRPVVRLGVPAAFLMPLVPAVHALRLFGRLRAAADRSWLVFLIGLWCSFRSCSALAMGAHRGDARRSAGCGAALRRSIWSCAFGMAGAWIVFAAGGRARSRRRRWPGTRSRAHRGPRGAPTQRRRAPGSL